MLLNPPKSFWEEAAAASRRLRVGRLREPFVQWAFGSFHLDPQQRVLLRVIDQGEETVSVGSRALDILILLVRRRSALVTKNELIEAVWPGVAVEDNNLTVQMSALRRALGDGQNGARLIETVSGRGYRFVAPVIEIIEPPADAPPDLIDQPTTPIASDRPRFALKSRHAAFAFVVLAATLVGVIMIGQAGSPDTRPALSIVVLPLATGDGDPAHDYIAEAITDDLTTQMASIEGAFVIGRETANAFRGQTNSRRTADQLGVRYLLEGSFHSVGTRIIVNAAL